MSLLVYYCISLQKDALLSTTIPIKNNCCALVCEENDILPTVMKNYYFLGI